jgi:hypothetical protein
VKSSHLPALVLCAALAFLELASLAQGPPKTTPRSVLTTAQTEERIKQLESRAEAAEKAAASAAMEKDYITRVQKQYESYYEKAFNTAITIFGLISVIIAVIAIVAGKLSLNFFDRRVQTAIAEASARLRTEITAAMNTELGKLRKENASQSEKLDTTLTAKITQLGQDLSDRSSFLFLLSQGLVMGTAQRFADANDSFRRALKLYQACKPRHVLSTEDGILTVRNLFVGLSKENPDTLLKRAEEELASPLYDDLDSELASAALQTSWLVPLVNERKRKPLTPPAPAPATLPQS